MITRRGLIAGSAFAASSSLFTGHRSVAEVPRFEAELPIPALVDARAQGNAVALTASRSTHPFLANRPAATYGYSSRILGPAIRLRRGDEIEIAVENKLDRGTTVHWHGLIIPSDQDGAPHDNIAPGKVWRSHLKIDQPETTAWFHPHPYRDTARQVYFGLAGLLLIDDGTSERLDLPRTYGVDDLPVIIQDRSFDPSGELVYDSSPMAVMQGARGDDILVNAAIAPVARVPAGLVRLRILNGANARNFDLSFADKRTFHVIASDGGYLAAPIALTRIWISPGERFELLVDFSDGRAVVLGTGTDAFTPMTMGMMGGGVSGAGAVMKFVPDRTKAASKASIRSRLVELAAPNRSTATRRRRFVLNDHMMGGMGMMGGGARGIPLAINGEPFDMERINVETKLGTTELWEIVSGMMAHPFHVHGVQFRVLSIDGRIPPPHLQGWKDTVLVPRAAEILVQFTQPATREHPFMYHCHILEHEDAGMMGQYVSS